MKKVRTSLVSVVALLASCTVLYEQGVSDEQCRDEWRCPTLTNSFAILPGPLQSNDPLISEPVQISLPATIIPPQFNLVLEPAKVHPRLIVEEPRPQIPPPPPSLPPETPVITYRSWPTPPVVYPNCQKFASGCN